MQNLRIVSVNTTAYSEENFILLTTLSDEQIEKAICPIIEKEREDSENWYDNDMLIQAIEDAYPNEICHMYDRFETLSV